MEGHRGCYVWSRRNMRFKPALSLKGAQNQRQEKKNLIRRTQRTMTIKCFYNFRKTAFVWRMKLWSIYWMIAMKCNSYLAFLFFFHGSKKQNYILKIHSSMRPYHSNKKRNRYSWALCANSLPHAGDAGLLSSTLKVVRGYLWGKGKWMVRRTESICREALNCQVLEKKNQQGVCLLLFCCSEGSWRKMDIVVNFQRNSLRLRYFISKLELPPAYWHSPLQ